MAFSRDACFAYVGKECVGKVGNSLPGAVRILIAREAIFLKLQKKI